MAAAFGGMNLGTTMVSDGSALVATGRASRQIPRWTPVAALVGCVLLSGCSLRTLKRDIEVASQQASLEGRVEIRSGASEPVVVVAEHAGTGQVADLFLIARPGPFFLTLPAGRYRVGAFEDLNRDLTYQPGTEPAALLGANGEVDLAAGESRRDVTMTIGAQPGVVLPFAVSALSAERTIGQMPSLQIGTIASLDDPRFGDEYGSLGMWDPIRFMFEAGGGIYFLEPYDPQKIPILFVHGATGSPANWKYLASRIDRTKFQPWFAYYPAAPHLDRIGEQLVRALSSLKVKYRYDRLILVGHSMGGLVTRAALNYVIGNAATGRRGERAAVRHSLEPVERPLGCGARRGVLSGRGPDVGGHGPGERVPAVAAGHAAPRRDRVRPVLQLPQRCGS